jgi:AcrR family transcriptional regulator
MGSSLPSEISNQQVLEAALAELHDVGPSQLRLRRVAKQANVSIGLISDHFGDREGLITAAVLYRLDQLMLNLFGPILDISDEEALTTDRLDQFERELIAPEVWHDAHAARQEYLQLHSYLSSNKVALATLDESRQEARKIILAKAQLFVDNGLTAAGVTAVTFVRVVFGVLYGQVFFNDQAGLQIEPDEWALALQLVMRSVFRPTALPSV